MTTFRLFKAEAVNTDGDNIRIEILVPEQESRSDSDPVIRFFTGDRIDFQARGTTAHNLVADLWNAIEHSGVGEVPFLKGEKIWQ